MSPEKESLKKVALEHPWLKNFYPDHKKLIIFLATGLGLTAIVTAALQNFTEKQVQQDNRYLFPQDEQPDVTTLSQGNFEHLLEVTGETHGSNSQTFKY